MHNRTIFKQQLEMTHLPQRFDLPFYAEILCFQFQEDIPCIWYSFHEPPHMKGQKFCKSFQIFGTGSPAVHGKYIGTAQKSGFVWHLYDIDNF